MAIRSYLKKRGFEVDFFYARFRMRKYIRQYAEITRQEEGKPGFWHRSYQISMILALVLVVIGLLIN